MLTTDRDNSSYLPSPEHVVSTHPNPTVHDVNKNCANSVEVKLLPLDSQTPRNESGNQSSQKRPVCTRCSRPQRVCICYTLPSNPIPTSTRVIIIQTLAEAKAKVRTADIVPLVLRNATIVPAKKGFDTCIPSDATLLFPGHNAVPLESLRGSSNTLVFIDATWDKAQRLLDRSDSLKALARAFLSDQVLGKALFRARKPPASIKGARSTAEAVAGALQCVDAGSYSDAAAALRRCVYEASECQLRFVRAKGEGAGKHRKERAGYEEGWYNRQP